MEIKSNRVVDVDGCQIIYYLEQKPVKNLNLRIRKDCSVFVSANPAVPLETIDAFVCSKASYIFDAIDRFREIAQYKPQPKQYVSGETFNVLGRGLRLQVSQDTKSWCPRRPVCWAGAEHRQKKTACRCGLPQIVRTAQKRPFGRKILDFSWSGVA